MKFKGGKTTSIQGNVNNHFSWWYNDADGPITTLKEGIGKSFNRQNLGKISGRLTSEGSQPHGTAGMGVRITTGRAELPIVLMVLKHRAPCLRGAPHP